MADENVVILSGLAGRISQATLAKQIQRPNVAIICADAGIKPLAELGVTADFLVGDLDTINRTRQHFANFSHLVKAPSEKDVTDTELALQVAAKHYPTAKTITILGWNGGRFDHLLANVAWVNRRQFESVIAKVQLVDEHNVVRFLPAGSHTVKFIPGFNYIGVVVLADCHNLTIKNFKYELPKCDVAAITAYASNEFCGTAAGQISFASGIVAIIYSRD